MKTTKIIVMASFAALLSTAALADPTSASSVPNMANGGQVSLQGTVEDFNSSNSFTLRDSTGTVKIDLSSAKSVVLKNGEKVNVTGVINKGVISTTVVANNVSEDKALGQKLGEAIDSATGQTPDSDAKMVAIKSLPESGLVKISGTVSDVDSEKKFTVNDTTGKVDVKIKSGESAALHKGSGVTVVGYVNSGLLGKTIDATKVETGAAR